MKLIYIAGPFSAPTRDGVETNILAATLLGVEVAKIGAFPVVPHANTAHPEYERVQPYPFWIEGTLRQLATCDAVMLLPTWRESSGARGEVKAALLAGQPVFESLDALKAWLDLEARGEALGCPRRKHETDYYYAQRLHDLACGMAGCP